MNFKKQGFTIMELVITTLIMAVICIVAPTIILKKETQGNSNGKTGPLGIIINCIGGDAGVDTDGLSITNQQEKECIYNSKTYILSCKSGATETYTPINDIKKNKHSLYEITLIGGGAGGYKSAGSDKNVGSAGQIKKIHLWLLSANKGKVTDSGTEIGISNGYFYLKAGKGGDENQNGGDTIFCTAKVDASGNPKYECDEEIARAKGGFSKYASNDLGTSDGSICNNKKGNTSIDKHYGMGGYYSSLCTSSSCACYESELSPSDSQGDGKGKAGAIIIE